ncbi:uncharacterized protein LOC143911661 [Arctopsyche grandis]|uniref:uncharacterized protein LOC143911661 n=1 Tax=Arctopsyche grandis TaxID=121162 RepID=UPI00406D8E56
MKLKNLALFSGLGLHVILFTFLSEVPQTALAQDPAFELPVQLIGFPVIILFVRLANFVKKLSYSLDPNTYRRRTRRGAITDDSSDEHIDVSEAEKKLVAALGQGVCVYERVCAHYAARALRKRNRDVIDWGTIFRQYKRSPDRNKEFYLLSVFLGDIVASPNLCHQLAKRGRSCSPQEGWEQR